MSSYVSVHRWVRIIIRLSYFANFDSTHCEEGSFSELYPKYAFDKFLRGSFPKAALRARKLSTDIEVRVHFTHQTSEKGFG